MPLVDWEYSYLDLVFGGASDYPITDIEGLDPPDSREDTITKSIEHGSFIYAQYLEDRTISFKGFMMDNDSEAFQTKLSALKVALLPQTTTRGLHIKWPGLPELLSWCVPKRRNFKINTDWSNGYTDWAMQFRAGDPRLYAATESEANAAGILENAGIFPTPPVVTITGSYIDPTLTNVTTGEVLSLTDTDDATLIIDFANRVITKDDVSSYHLLDPLSIWWNLLAGDNEITYTGGGTIEFRWRSAWI